MAMIPSGTTPAPFASAPETAAIPALPASPSLIGLRILCVLGALLAAGDGGWILMEAKSAMQQGVAYQAFTIAAIFFCTGALLEAARVIVRRGD